MKVFPLLGLGALACLLTAGSLSADVLTFDTISTGGTWAVMPNSYGGFTWGSTWNVANNSWYNSTYADSVAFPSTLNAVYNSDGVVTVATTSNTPFSFLGADFAAWVENNQLYAYSSSSVTVDGYLNGNAVGTATMNLASNGTFSFLTVGSGFGNVDKLTFTNDGANQHWWLMDNFTYGAAVPEPGSIFALLAGLGALALRRRQLC